MERNKTSSGQEELDRGLAALEARFLAGLSDREAALRAASSRLVDDPAGAQVEVRRLAHALRGTAATYRYPDLARLAAAVEDASACDLVPRLDELYAGLAEHRGRRGP